MNKTLAITAIALVAVVMGLSTIAPVLQQAFAHDVTNPPERILATGCPPNFNIGPISLGVHPDHNFNELVCRKAIGMELIVIDDDVPSLLIPQ